MTPHSILTQLSSGQPFFNSHELLQHWMHKVTWVTERAESQMRVPPTLSTALNSLSPEWKAFIVRSTPFRVAFEQMHLALVQVTADQDRLPSSYFVLSERLEQYLEVLRPSAQHRLDSTEDEVVASAIGYDMANPLTGPFPLVSSALGSKGQSLEAAEIAEIYNRNSDAITAGRYELAEFQASEIEALRSAIGSLSRASPWIAFDISMNVRTFALLEPRGVPPASSSLIPLKSITTNLVPGTCFLTRAIFERPELVAEFVYHESLHMKYFQTVATQKLHYADFSGSTRRLFHCPWTSETGRVDSWPFSRAMAAWHVYLHLIAWYATLLDSGEEGGGVSENASDSPSLLGTFDGEWVRNRLALCLEKGSILFGYVSQESQQAFTPLGLEFFEALASNYRALLQPELLARLLGDRLPASAYAEAAEYNAVGV